MQDRATPALRWWRALVLAGVAFGLGLLAHVAAGGLVPGRVGLAALFLLTLTGCAAFLARAASTLRITTLVVAGQAFIHTTLTASSGHAGDRAGHVAAAAGTPGGDPLSLVGADRSGSLHDIYERGSLARGTGRLVVPDWAQHLVDDLTGPHAAMALAHVVAAALVGLWLASGERALWALIRLSRHAIAGPVRQLSAALAAAAPVPPGGPDAQPRLDGTPARRLHSVLLASTHSRRGPPALLAA